MDLTRGDISLAPGATVRGAPVYRSPGDTRTQEKATGSFWDGAWRLAGEYGDRLGRCYELAGRHVAFSSDDEVLVHGTIQGGGNPRIGHAWVELPSGKIYDPVLDQEFDPEVHKSFFSAQEEERFTQDEVQRMISDHGHWGPWDEPKTASWKDDYHPDEFEGWVYEDAATRVQDMGQDVFDGPLYRGLAGVPEEWLDLGVEELIQHFSDREWFRMHWTPDFQRAKDFASKEFGIIIEAENWDIDDIEEDEEALFENSVLDYAAEHEVPLKRGTELNVTRIHFVDGPSHTVEETGGTTIRTSVRDSWDDEPDEGDWDISGFHKGPLIISGWRTDDGSGTGLTSEATEVLGRDTLLGPGVYFAPTPDHISAYGGEAYPVEVELQNPYIITLEYPITDIEGLEELPDNDTLEWIRNQGYDGIILLVLSVFGFDETQGVAFDPGLVHRMGVKQAGLDDQLRTFWGDERFQETVDEIRSWQRGDAMGTDRSDFDRLKRLSVDVRWWSWTPVLYRGSAVFPGSYMEQWLDAEIGEEISAFMSPFSMDIREALDFAAGEMFYSEKSKAMVIEVRDVRGLSLNDITPPNFQQYEWLLSGSFRIVDKKEVEILDRDNGPSPWSHRHRRYLAADSYTHIIAEQVWPISRRDLLMSQEKHTAARGDYHDAACEICGKDNIPVREWNDDSRRLCIVCHAKEERARYEEKTAATQPRLLPEFNEFNELQFKPDDGEDDEGPYVGYSAYHEDGDEPVGSIWAAPLIGDTWEITNVHVSEDWRRKGVATELLWKLRQNHPELEIVHGMTISDEGREWSQNTSRVAVSIHIDDTAIEIPYLNVRAMDGDRQVGMLDGPVFNNTLRIDQIFVEEEYRRQGIASLMLDTVREEYDIVEIEDNDNVTDEGQAFLRAQGTANDLEAALREWVWGGHSADMASIQKALEFPPHQSGGPLYRGITADSDRFATLKPGDTIHERLVTGETGGMSFSENLETTLDFAYGYYGEMPTIFELQPGAHGLNINAIIGTDHDLALQQEWLLHGPFIVVSSDMIPTEDVDGPGIIADEQPDTHYLVIRQAHNTMASGTMYDEGYADQATDGKPEVKSLADAPQEDREEYAQGVADANGGTLPDSLQWGLWGVPEDGTEAAEDLHVGADRSKEQEGMFAVERTACADCDSPVNVEDTHCGSCGEILLA